ncbi:flippase-like domain-containing protein, partial [Candidatus Woesearchaeota archaeon]|nr:flippase-like domain-containing protein [Candidatus Woesearchaeota archaeon]
IGALVWRWRNIITAQQKKSPNYWELCRYFLVAYAVSYVTPGAKIGGELFRAGLLARHNSFKEASSTVFIDKTIEMSVMGTFFIIGAALLLLMHAAPAGATAWMTTIALLLLVLIILFYYQMFSGKDFIGKLFKLTQLHRTKQGKKWSRSIHEFEQLILQFYAKDKRHFFSAVLLSLLSIALTFIEYSIVLRILGVENVTILPLFLVITFIGAAYLIPIPMALGTLEAGQVGVFRMIGLPGAAGIGVAIITRMKDIVLSIIGFTLMGFYGLHLGKNVLRKKKKGKIRWDF